MTTARHDRVGSVMDRRVFFKTGARKAAQVAYHVAGERAAQRAKHWIRPPFALPEVDFLISCSRCDACIEACPHQVLFPLAARLGATVMGTPAMDLLNRACRLCEDWPCVAACEPGTLELPEAEEEPLPRLAHAAIDKDSCLPYSGPECGACAHACPVTDALQWQGGVKPVIDVGRCTGCAMCREACIVSPKAVAITSLGGKEQ